MQHAKDIVLKAAIERFISERKCKRVGPNKHTLSIWSEHHPYDQLDGEISSIVMTNPYTGEDFVYGVHSSEVYIMEEDSSLYEAIGNPTKMFSDLFDVKTEGIGEKDYLYNDEYQYREEKITINGAGLLFEIIEDNIDVLDKFYEKKSRILL